MFPNISKYIFFIFLHKKWFFVFFFCWWEEVFENFNIFKSNIIYAEGCQCTMVLLYLASTTIPKPLGCLFCTVLIGWTPNLSSSINFVLISISHSPNNAFYQYIVKIQWMWSYSASMILFSIHFFVHNTPPHTPSSLSRAPFSFVSKAQNSIEMMLSPLQ